MKFLIRNLFLVIIFFQSSFTQGCFETWFEKNISNEKNIYFISAIINDKDKITAIIDKNKKYKIQILDKIIIGENKKISSFSKLTNQLYIEKADVKLNELVFSFFNIESFKNNIKINNSNHLKLKKSSYGNVEFFLDSNCESIDSLIIKNNSIKLKSIAIDSSFYEVSNDSLFMFNFVNEKEIFKYDFR